MSIMIYTCVSVALMLTLAGAKTNQEVILNRGALMKHVDCQEIRDFGYTVSGLYDIWLNGTKLTVFCNHAGPQSAIVIQQRLNGQILFKQGWQSYANGFGTPSADYWMGLESIHQFTTAGNSKLTIFLTDWSQNSVNVFYDHFVVLSSSDRYRLSVSGFHGSEKLGDDFSDGNGHQFATYDNPDVNHCAVNQMAGWWYNYCSYALLNGHYYYGGPYTPSTGFYDGIYWNSWRGFGYSLKFVMMQISRS